MSKIQNRIREFWDSQPCGTTHLDLPPHSREYFIEFDKYFEALYPYYFPYLDLESMRGRRVMEIGLGSGASLHRIAQVAQTCIGLDLSGGTIELLDFVNGPQGTERYRAEVMFVGYRCHQQAGYGMSTKRRAGNSRSDQGTKRRM